ncbi:MAG: CNP1-like family protein [Pseudomonadota bacterium]
MSRFLIGGAMWRRLILRRLLERRGFLLYTARPMHGTSRFHSAHASDGTFSFRGIVLAVVMVVVATPLYAARNKFGEVMPDNGYVETPTAPWKESEVAIPAYPEDKDLVSISLSSRDTLKLYIDPKSFSRAADGVARITLVVESPSGVRSVFFDGMRCDTPQYKTYAVGTSDRKFSPARNAKWQAIPTPAFNAFRDYLYNKYLCDGYPSTARTPEEFVKAIK